MQSIKSQPGSYQRTERIRYDHEFSSLPPRAWRFAQLTGSIIHKSWFTPVTRRDGLVQIANLELLRNLVGSFSALPPDPSTVEQWLKGVEENYDRRMKSTVCMVLYFLNPWINLFIVFRKWPKYGMMISHADAVKSLRRYAGSGKTRKYLLSCLFHFHSKSGMQDHRKTH